MGGGVVDSYEVVQVFSDPLELNRTIFIKFQRLVDSLKIFSLEKEILSVTKCMCLLWFV